MGRTIGIALSLKDMFSPGLKTAMSNAKKLTEETKKVTSALGKWKNIKFDGLSRETRNAQNNIHKMKQKTDSATSALSRVKGVVAGIGFLAAAKESIELASSLAEVSNVVDVTFGNNAKKIYDWSNTALKSFGLTKLEAEKYNGVLGSLLKSSGVSSDKLVEMSTHLTGLAGDFASFFDSSPEEAFEKIKSGISGETDPLKAWGINMSVANMQQYALTQGIHKKWNAMSQSEQTLLRYNYLMKISTDQQGDFNRTSNSFSNQLKLSQANLKELGGSLASLVLPALNKFLLFFNGALGKLPKLGNAIKKFISPLPNQFNTAFNTIKNFCSNIFSGIVKLGSDLAKPFFETINAIKNFATSRIVEIANVLDFSSKIKGLSAFDILKSALTNVLTAIKDIFNFINNNWNILEPIIAGVTVGILAYNVAIKLATLYTKALEVAQKAWAIATKVVATATALLNGTLAISPFGWIIIAIGAVIGFGVLLCKNWNWIIQTATMLKNKLVSSFLFIKNKIFESITFAWNFIKTKANNFIIFIHQILTRIKQNISSVYKNIINWCKSIATSIYKFLYPVRKIFEAIFKGILAIVLIVGFNILKGFKLIWNTVYKFISSALKNIFNKFKTTWNVIYKFISSILINIFNVIKNKFLMIYNIIKSMWSAVYSVIANICSKIWAFISKAWNSIYTSISSILSSIFNTMKSIWDSISSTVSGVVSKIWNCIVQGFSSAKDSAIGIFTSLKNQVLNIFNGIWSGIKSIINTGIGMINGFIGGVNTVINTANKIPGVKIGTVSTIPKFAKGTNYSPNGWAILNEKGGELRKLSSGETIIPADKSAKLLEGKGLNSNITINLTIQGNLIGNEDYANYMGNEIVNRLKIALQNT